MSDEDNGRDNLDEELATEWQNIQARHMGEDELDPEPRAPAADEGRARDEQGRFAPKAEAPQAEKPEAPTGKESLPVAQGDEEQPDEQASARDLARPPSSWKPAAKAAWEALPADIRAEVHRREQNFLEGQARLLPDAELGRNMRQTIEPYRMLIEAEGGTPERAVASLLQTAALFRVGTPQQKQAALYQIAQQYGVPLPSAQEAEQPQGAAPGEFRDPRLDALLQQAEMQRMEAARQQQMREQYEINRLDQVVAQWSEAVDSNGKELRPYYSNVEGDIAALIPQIRAANPGAKAEDVLQQAYDRACWAHPEIRPLLLRQQQDQMEASRRAENQLRVQKAKQAASMNLPRRASVPAASNDRRGIDRMEDVIAETARELGLIN